MIVNEMFSSSKTVSPNTISDSILRLALGRLTFVILGLAESGLCITDSNFNGP